VFGVSELDLRAGTLLIMVLALVTAVGAAANSNRARTVHLLVWLVMLSVAVSGQTIGLAAQS